MSSPRYSALQTDDLERPGLAKSAPAGSTNPYRVEEGLSYDSIFTYSSLNDAHPSSDRFTEYWRPTEYTVINESRTDEDGGNVMSFIRLFTHPPFAIERSRSANRSALTTDTESIVKPLITFAQHAIWILIFTLFSFAWLFFFPFHWYWTLRRVRLNEAVVVFRAGQAPIVRKKVGSLVCIWPLLDRMHRVTLSRRGFNVPPTQIGLNDGSLVRLGADISFHVTDALRFVRMSTDTSTSIRHVVHGQFIQYLGNQSLDSLQKFTGGVQTELRQIVSRHLSQFGVFVDTFTLSQPEVLRQPADPGRELMKTVLSAFGSSNTINPLSSIMSSGMPFIMPNGMSASSATVSNASPSQPQGNSNSLDKTMTSRITEFLSDSLRRISPETRASLNITPDTVFRLTLGSHDSWLLFPYTGHVDGPTRPPQNGDIVDLGGYKERASIYLANWETLEQLRENKLSPLVATMSGLLSVSGDSSALSQLFDPSKMQ